MWIGNLREIEECSLLSKQAVEQIRSFFRENDLQSLPLGTYALSENNFVNIFNYVTGESNDVYEAHKKYVDIHYVIEGEEREFYAEKFSAITQRYDQKDDYYLGTAEEVKSLSLNSGKLVVFNIDEPHKAGVVWKKVGYVKKAVFKIEV